MAESKKKCKYSVDYLKFGFIPSLSDKQLSMCFLCNKLKFRRDPQVDKMFASTSQRDDDGLRASYNISLLTYSKIRKTAYHLRKVENIASH
ncbi:hypothetical protein NQ318_007243 [Aromia moschata]|uniref:Uncharacterized protein n=1 Tax=Aromia moschata TaxID=1265417 RepID=A0AAV8X3B4_9CUCU|nr:hypothetical protein NQ318_007243 [Aromia moschata]